MPDLFLPVARRGFHGLFIEMKEPKKGRPTGNQPQWEQDVKGEGYGHLYSYGWEQAASALEWYLTE